MNASPSSSGSGAAPRLTELAHGGGCGCKIAPGVLADAAQAQLRPCRRFPNLLVGSETADDAAVYRLNDEQAIVATTDFFMPIVDDPYDFGRIAATNALSDIYAMGGKPTLRARAGRHADQRPAARDDRSAFWKAANRCCAEAGIPVAGGHSIDSVEPIYGLAAIGVVHPKRVKRNAAARAGDVLVLGKPLGVGVLSAALKKERLDAAGYAAMIATTTKLNRPGTALAALEGVHAHDRRDRFRSARPPLEMCRGAGLCARVCAMRSCHGSSPCSNVRASGASSPAHRGAIGPHTGREYRCRAELPDYRAGSADRSPDVGRPAGVCAPRKRRRRAAIPPCRRLRRGDRDRHNERRGSARFRRLSEGVRRLGAMRHARRIRYRCRH